MVILLNAQKYFCKNDVFTFILINEVVNLSKKASRFKKIAFKNTGITCTAERLAKRKNHDVRAISKKDF